jgi:hypothetical protein
VKAPPERVRPAGTVVGFTDATSNVCPNPCTKPIAKAKTFEIARVIVISARRVSLMPPENHIKAFVLIGFRIKQCALEVVGKWVDAGIDS